MKIGRFLRHTVSYMISIFFILFLASCEPAFASLELAHEQLSASISSSASGDWPSYLRGIDRSGYNATETAITTSSVSQLKLRWIVREKYRVFSQPVVVHGLIYWGSEDGTEHATDMDGHTVWTVNMGTSHPQCSDDFKDKVGVLDTPTVAPMMIGGKEVSVLFIGGGNGRFYALNAATGAIIWSRVLGDPPAHFLWSSPAIYNGYIFEGVSSLDDCPLVQGRLVQMDTSTGKITHIFNTVPDGCLGGSIWSSPTIDVQAGTVYVSTGNPGTCSTTEPYAPALIKLRASDLTLLDVWQVPLKNQIDDSDFGATPTLFDATISGVQKQLVGLVNKNGKYYAFDRTTIGRGPVWIAKAGGANTVAPSAWDGTHLYLGGRKTRVQGMKCDSVLEALNPSTGAYLWRHCLDGPIFGAIIVVPGVAFVSDGSYFYAMEADNGRTLFRYTDTSANFVGPVSIANGMLFVGSYNGGLYAFGL
jgi:outer membrane protein assembly factor BamB